MDPPIVASPGDIIDPPGSETVDQLLGTPQETLEARCDLRVLQDFTSFTASTSGDTHGTDIIFTFARDQALVDPCVSVEIPVGTDLAIWPLAYTLGEDTASSTEGVTVTITITAPQATHSGRFVRLKVVIAE